MDDKLLKFTNEKYGKIRASLAAIHYHTSKYDNIQIKNLSIEDAKILLATIKTIKDEYEYVIPKLQELKK